jgi:hypothetical protein
VFNGPPAQSIWAETRDYVSNGGVSSVFKYGEQLAPRSARVGLTADVFSPFLIRRPGAIAAGYSNTFAAWECSGSQVYSTSRINGRLSQMPWSDISDTIVIRADYGVDGMTTLVGRANVNRYVASSLGFFRGYIALFDWGLNPIRSDSTIRLHSHRVINVTNRYHGPFSFHANFANFVLLDGSVRSFSQDSDPGVIMSYATIGEN